MLVVSDTSPLNYLILIDAVHVLPVMYHRVIIPEAVANELSALGTPVKAKTWFAARPLWIEILPAPAGTIYPELDAGEAEAIFLAKELHADLLLTDERRATAIARDRAHLRTTGTLGVLLDAALLKLIDLPTALHTLRHQTTFQAPPHLFQQVLDAFQKRYPIQ